ncbi:DUF3040 domain-containing protein [Streptomyces lomondensis]|uniref:DUF3040 domain-containing protein n=1 Tax=Streptomyces lomondensis TaxID=68229 RepID=A0ABQ2X8M5_9ACTN|nr:DUF3040 domain-containing protein [Streptomyces lomondensis]MCF0077376.1 DUF3040 domain-containing protein [Streptomyces lomondensis]GGX04625.1 hypothetical protein GCM10010383_38120 [Streptomyces lomondensis]
MSIGRLPENEQRILDEMERALRRDRRLDRRMRTLRPSRRPDPARVLGRMASYRPRGVTVAILLVVSVALMVAGIVTSEPGVIWAFAAVWPLTLFAVFRLMCRWCEG